MSLIQGRGQRITYLDITQKLNPEAVGIDKSTNTEKVQDRFRESSELLGDPNGVFSHINAVCILLWNKAKTFLEEEWALFKFIKWNIKQKIQVGTERRPAGRRIDYEDNNTQSLRLFISKESREFCARPLLMKRIFSLSFVKSKRYSKVQLLEPFSDFFFFSDILFSEPLICSTLNSS